MEMKRIFRNEKLYLLSEKNYDCCGKESIVFKDYKIFQGKCVIIKKVGFCEKCKKYFIVDDGDENLMCFCDYNVYDYKTKERIRFIVKTNWKRNTRCPKWETKWKGNGGTIEHPYQGGACSGK